METNKINPIAYIKAIEIFTDRLQVKKIIPIPFEDAVAQVLFDMNSMFDDAENREAFRMVIDNFRAMTYLEDWYKE